MCMLCIDHGGSAVLMNSGPELLSICVSVWMAVNMVPRRVTNHNILHLLALTE